jgi:tRNA threonylcarbamoyladenosine biosynthesis protein TsaB
MIVLALETSGNRASVAVLEKNHLISSADVPARETAKLLVPTIKLALNDAGLSTRDIGLVAVASGPGSFTGLRIGVTTAKTLVYAISAKLVAVNTLEVVALQAASADGDIECIMNAHRGQLFAARYRSQKRWPQPDRPTQVLAVRDWLNQLPSGSLVTGPAVEIVLDRLHESRAGVQIAAESLRHPRAEFVGKLAWHRHLRKVHDDPWTLEPQYYRASAAEEKAGRDS